MQEKVNKRPTEQKNVAERRREARGALKVLKDMRSEEGVGGGWGLIDGHYS